MQKALAETGKIAIGQLIMGGQLWFHFAASAAPDGEEHTKEESDRSESKQALAAMRGAVGF